MLLLMPFRVLFVLSILLNIAVFIVLSDFIKKDKLNSPEKIKKAIKLIDRLDNERPSDYRSALMSGIEAISQPSSQTLAENRRRRRY